MEIPNTKQSSQKNNTQFTFHQATPKVMRSASPLQPTRFNHSWSRDEMKELQRDKVKGVQKHVSRERTKAADFKLHTQQRAVSRAIFNYTVATKVYFIERQKKQVEKLQKMIEEEEVRMLRKEMVPKAQLMPLFDKPFYPQRSTRPLTIPKEPRMMSDKCSSRFSFYNLFSLPYNEAH